MVTISVVKINKFKAQKLNNLVKFRQLVVELGLKS